jgi:hypothetical protein
MSRNQRSKSKYNSIRRPQNLPLRESFLIFCEGETEVGYFTSFQKRARLTSGGNALKVVENAVAYKNACEKRYDHYWAVFDKDETTDEQFAQAIRLAEANQIRVAWSNQAFECWIILHYRDFKHACNRSEYELMIKKHLPGYNTRQKGEEQGRQLHLLTTPHLPKAIQRAKAGFASFEQALPAAQKQTSTLVYELIESILAFG